MGDEDSPEEVSAENLAMEDSGFAVSGEEIPSPGRRFNAARPQYTSPRTCGASRHDTEAATTTSPQGDGTTRFFLSLFVLTSEMVAPLA
jgi:hypothetical protein